MYLALSGLHTKQAEFSNSSKADGQGSSGTKHPSAPSSAPSGLKNTQRKRSDLSQPKQNQSTSRKESPPAKRVRFAPISSVKKRELAKNPVAADSNLDSKVQVEDVDNNNGPEVKTQVCRGKISYMH